MLKYRIIASFVLIPLVIAALFMLSPTSFAVLTAVVCVLGAWEWAPLAGFNTIKQRIGIAVVCGALLMFILGWEINSPSQLLSNLITVCLWLSAGWWLIALLLVLTYPHSARRWQHSYVLRLLFGLFILVPFFCGVLALRSTDYANQPYFGSWWLLYVMVLVWGADTGAYAFGKWFGKHKLAPRVSPGKTWEGICGGVGSSALIAWLFSYYSPLQVNSKTLLICSVITVLASILGDLTESMLKRQAGIKDSGNLIPGHGGILDRIDSLTAAVPIFACSLLLVFGVQ